MFCIDFVRVTNCFYDYDYDYDKSSYLMVNIIVTLKCGSEITQGH